MIVYILFYRFIESDKAEYNVKVGVTKNLAERIRSLQTARLPSFIFTTELDDKDLALKVENFFLSYFEKSSTNGEWIEITKEQWQESMGMYNQLASIFNFPSFIMDKRYEKIIKGSKVDV